MINFKIDNRNMYEKLSCDLTSPFLKISAD